MSYVLYSYPDCASQVVRMALEELDAGYRDEVVEMQGGGFPGAEFRRLNPRGLVPVLVDEASGAVLAETGAILEFLAEQTGRLAPLPSDAPRRALFLQWLYFLSNTLHADAQVMYYTGRYVGADLADQARPHIKQRLRAHFAMLDAQIAEQGGPWLLGEDLSMCDFYLGGCVRWSLIAPRHDPLEPEAVTDLPRLNNLLERLEGRDSVLKAFAAEGTPRSAFFRAPVRSAATSDKKVS